MEPDRACMSPEEVLLWDLVSGHRGQARAIEVAALASMTGLDERVVRRTVKHLIEQFGCPIASTTEPPYGYFVPSTLEEEERYYASLRSRGLSILGRAAAFRHVTLPALLGQLAMDLHSQVSPEASDANPGHAAD
jgi:hypothetical protein